jgi:hypothetical protein
MTVVELAVVIALGTVVFGLILGALVQTSRASQDLVVRQQMRQEAMLIAQSVEKVLRFRVDGGDLVVAEASAGAAPESSAGKSTVPRSLEETLRTTASAARASTPAPARTPTAAELTSVPATLKPLLTGTTESAALERPRPQPGERYTAAELGLFSLSGKAEKPLALIRNSKGLEGEPRHAYVEWAPAGKVESAADAEGGAVEPLGSSSDRLQSSISFRYASGFDGLKARWQAQSGEVPRLVEYTVRVWPRSAGPDFHKARNAAGQSVGFEYTSAVRLR